MSQSSESIHKPPAQILVIGAFAAIYLIWGSTYLAILVAIRTIPPFLMLGIRFLIAGALLLAWCRLQGQKMPALHSLKHISLSGVLMLFGGTGAVVWVEQHIPTHMAAIIVATVPLWFVLLDRYQWKFHFTSKRIILGLLIGFGGVVLLFADTAMFNFSGNRMAVISFFVLLAGTMLWATGSLYAKYKEVQGSPAIKASIQLLAAGVATSVVALLSGDVQRVAWDLIALNSVLAMAYLILAGSLIGYMSYIWLLSFQKPSLVGTYAYVNPVVAVFLGWMILGEEITVQKILALVVIIFGVILVNLGKRTG